MLHFKYDINNLLRINKKKIWRLAIILITISLSLKFIVFSIFRENQKSDIKNNKKDFAIVSGYSKLNYKGEENEEEIKEDYLEAFKIYKDIIENPTNDFEKAISYNLSYLENLSEGREYMVKLTDRKLTKDSFLKAKKKYGLIISEEDKKILNENSQLIKKQINSIDKIKDKFILISSLDTLDYILDLDIDDEILLLSNVSRYTFKDYLINYVVILFLSLILFLFACYFFGIL